VKVAVPKESEQGERRVALVPDTAKMLVAAGLEVSVEAGAGASAFITDDLYEKAGARVASRAGTMLHDADAVLKVQAPRESEISLLKKGAVLISFLQPATQADTVRSLARTASRHSASSCFPASAAPSPWTPCRRRRRRPATRRC